MAGAASQAGDADSSRAPGLTSGLQGSVNVHRGALLLVPQWQCTSSFVFYIERFGVNINEIFINLLDILWPRIKYSRILMATDQNWVRNLIIYSHGTVNVLNVFFPMTLHPSLWILYLSFAVPISFFLLKFEFFKA